jgi:hypothetical protein
MSTAFLKRACAWAGLVLVLTLPAAASPVKSPRRVVDQRTVDLSPLLHWWTNHTGLRPFTAWVHVTGNVVGTNAYGWVVDAQVEAHARPGQEEGTDSAAAGGAKRILLRHPPLQDRAAFEQLAARLKVLNQQRAQAEGAESQARNYLHPGSNGVHRVHYKGQGFANREAHEVEKNATASKQELDKQIKDAKSKMAAWPNSERYELDCFALDTATELNKLPLYEHGTSWQ